MCDVKNITCCHLRRAFFLVHHRCKIAKSVFLIRRTCFIFFINMLSFHSFSNSEVCANRRQDSWRIRAGTTRAHQMLLDLHYIYTRFSLCQCFTFTLAQYHLIPSHLALLAVSQAKWDAPSRLSYE